MKCYLFISVRGVATTQKMAAAHDGDLGASFDVMCLLRLSKLYNHLMSYCQPEIVIVGTKSIDERFTITYEFANAGMMTKFSDRKYDTAIEIADWAVKNSVALDRVPFVFIGDSVHDNIRMFSRGNLVWVRSGYEKRGFEEKHQSRALRKILAQILFLNAHRTF